MLRLWTIPYSTNVERITLALAFKELDVELVRADPADRSEVRALSGQELVPVLEDEGRIVADSPVILRHLEDRFPDPPLFPRDPARRAEVDTFVDWFNAVWKVPPNAIDAELGSSAPDERRIAEWSGWLAASLDRFEALLTGRRHLLGDAFGAADCVAFPFLKYALLPVADDDADTFHAVLSEHLTLRAGHAGLRRWIADVDARPRAG